MGIKSDWEQKIDECLKSYNLDIGDDAKAFVNDFIRISVDCGVTSVLGPDLYRLLKKYGVHGIDFTDFFILVQREEKRAEDRRVEARLHKLKACPFCGGSDLKYGYHYFENSDSSCRWVECCVCGGRTRGHRQWDDADKAWNRRDGYAE